MTLGHWRRGDSISRPFQETNLISANRQVLIRWLIIWGVYLFREFLKIIVLNIKYCLLDLLTSILRLDLIHEHHDHYQHSKLNPFQPFQRVIALPRNVKLKLPFKKNLKSEFYPSNKEKFISKFQKKGNI